MPAETTVLTTELTEKLKKDLVQQGISYEPYDADFILGTIMTWLATKDAALTSSGVKRIRH